MQDEKSLFDEGNIIYSYTDEQAVDDGVLILFKVGGRDTGHRITSNLYHDLKEHHKGYNYEDAEYLAFFFNELLALAPYAVREWDRNGILKSDYDFKVGETEQEKAIWYVPTANGVTMMKPEDY